MPTLRQLAGWEASLRSPARACLLVTAFFGACLSVGIPAVSSARDWVVPDDAPTVAAGIDSAQAGDTVTLLSGTYYEYDLVMKSGITLRGGTGDFMDVTIDANHMGRVMDASYTSGTTRIEDITFTHGYTPENGAGIYMDSSYAQIDNCAFSSNACSESGGSGGGVYVVDGGPSFTYCEFNGNSAGSPGSGGGLFIENAGPDVIDCFFVGNNAATSGGGVGLLGSDPVLTNCVFVVNTADAGGAVSASNSNPTLDQCTLARNSATGTGGAGIALFFPASVTLDHTIIARNLDGGSVYQNGTSSASVNCCDVYGNVGGDYIYFLSGTNGFDGNFSEDPLFCDVTGYDVRLSGCSPCADAPGCGLVGALGVGCTGRTWVVPSEDTYTIASAIDSAAACDTVYVLAGTYFEQGLVMKSGVTLRGELTTPDGPNEVVIDGQAFAQIMTGADLDDRTIIENITFSYGYTSGSTPGGAMGLTDSYVTVRHCDFLNNAADSGGAVDVSGGSPRFENCTFDHNVGNNSAGAVAVRVGASPQFDGCSFTWNQSTSSAVGGALSCYGSSTVTFTDCDLSYNSTDGDGAAIYSNGSQLVLVSCIITKNTAGLNGGALSCLGSAGTLNMDYCTLAENDAPNGSGLMLFDYSSATLENTIIAFGVTGEAVYCYGGAFANLGCCDVYANDGGDWTGCLLGQDVINGNFSLDPEFYLPAEDDYRLMPESPCLDAIGCGLVGALGAVTGQTYVVPDDYETIQEALDACDPGDTVVVACGTYDESDIELRTGVYLTSETGQPDCVTIRTSAMGRIFHASSIGDGAVVKGFTLAADVPYSGPGAGMYMVESSPVVEDCVFRGFVSGYEGGALYIGSSSAEFARCVFDSCRSWGDGGVASVEYSTPSFTDCVFSRNTASYSGGAFLFKDGCGPVFDRCTFTANLSGQDGSAIACVSDMLLRAAAACTLRNSIIAFGDGDGAATYCAGTGSVTLECCDVYGNSGGDYTGCLTGQNGVNGNISADPLFCGDDNPSEPLSLASISPCSGVNQPVCGQIGAFGVGCAGFVDWDAGGDGTTWEDPYNWDPDQVPGSGDHARIQLDATNTITFNSTRTVDALTIGEVPSDITLDLQTGTLTVTGDLTNYETIVVRGTAALDAPSAGRASNIVNESGATFQLDDGDLTGSGSFTNRGYFTKTGTGRSYVYVDFLNEEGGRGDDGYMDALAGTLDISGEFENLGRLNIITGQGTMISKHYIGRDEARAGSGTFLNEGLVDIDAGGSLIARADATISSSGLMSSRGELTVETGATFYNENGGEFALDDGDLVGSGDFINRGYFRKIGPGRSTILLAFTNDYVARAGNGLVEAEAGTLDIGGEFDNLGRLNIITGQGTMISKHYIRDEDRAGSGTFVNSGTVDLAHGGFFRANANTNVNSSGEFAVRGLVEVEPGASFASDGSVEVEPGGDFAARGAVTNQLGASFINSGRTRIPSGGVITNYGYFDHQENALLRGSGTFDTSVGLASMKGVIEPGDSPGMLSYVGDFNQTATSQIRVEIGGYSPGDEHDVLSIDGAAHFGGSLELVFLGDFRPVANDSFSVIVNTGGRGGRDTDFDCFSGLDVSDTLYMQPLQRPAAFRLRAVAGSLGNAAPVAADDYRTLQGQAPLSIPVLANDVDPDLDDIVVLTVFDEEAIGGVYVDPGDQSVTYFALPGFAGADSFRYVVGDCVSGADTAFVRVMVLPPPRTWHVPGDAPTIQAGVDSAAVGDTVVVACGTYYESDIVLKVGVTLLSETGDPGCVTIDASGRSGRVMSCVGGGGGTVVAGLTMRGGSTAESGGIVRCAGSSPRFVECVFEDGFGEQAGGGVAAEQRSEPSFEDCVFTGNYSVSGAAVAARDSSIVSLERCVFATNTAKLYGGAVYCGSGSEVELASCTLGGNAANEGGGIYVVGGDVTITRSIIADALYGGSVGCGSGGETVLSCTDVFGNGGGDWVGCIADQAGIDGNLSLDPMFCSPDSLDYRLQAGSPCADASGCGLVGALPVGCGPGSQDPDIDVAPLSLELSAGRRAAVCDTLMISNGGWSDLVWRIREEPLARRVGGASVAASDVRQRPSKRADSSSRSLEVEPGKGEPDTRTGERGSGGPDGFGYTWVDSDDAGGPAFEWFDITGVGTPLVLRDDDFREVALPFAFPFYGRPQDSVRVSSNGYLAFGTIATDYTHDPIPSLKEPGNFIAPLWLDLNPRLGGSIHYYHDVASGRFVVQYTNVYDYWRTGTKTFQVILKPDGSILFQYLDMNGNLNIGSIGVEDAGGAAGLQVVFNAPYVHDELAVLVRDAVPWLTQTPPGGTRGGSGSDAIEVCADPSGLEPGVYAVDLVFESNDPDEPEFVVGLTLSVVEVEPDIEVEPLEMALTVMGGEGACDTLLVTNAGGGALSWSVGRSSRDPGPHGQPQRLRARAGDTRGSGGPDAYGYTWVDSDALGGPEFEWVDISSIGIGLTLGGDAYAEVVLPFEFPFYGGSEYAVRIGSNGILTFGSGGDESLNAPVPSQGSPDGFVAPFWDDLMPDLGGAVHWYWNEVAGEFVVQYTDVPRVGEEVSSFSFQVALRGDGSIAFRYLEMAGPLDSATVGIESPTGIVGLPIAFNEAYVHDALAVEIAPACPWLTASPWSGVSAAGQPEIVSVCVDAAEMELGENTCNLLVWSDDPDSVTVIVPVLVYVTDTGVEGENTPGRYQLLGNFPNPFNPVTEIRYALPSPALVRLEVYDLSGRLVRTLMENERQGAGRYDVLWDGRDGRGAQVASGVYFYRLVADGEALTRKMILLK